jgi:valyl-tRNA synthetase
MRTELAHAEVSGPSDALALVERASEDLKAAGKIVGDLTFTPTDADTLTVRAQIVPPTD